MPDKPIIWRGSVTDLATDIAAELTAEDMEELAKELATRAHSKAMRLSEDRILARCQNKGHCAYCERIRARRAATS